MPRYGRISQLTWVAWRNSLRNLDVRYVRNCQVHWKSNDSIGSSYYSSRAGEITLLLTTQGNLQIISFMLSTLVSTSSAPMFWLIDAGFLSWRRQDSSQRRTRDFTIGPSGDQQGGSAFVQRTRRSHPDHRSISPSMWEPLSKSWTGTRRRCETRVPQFSPVSSKVLVSRKSST